MSVQTNKQQCGFSDNRVGRRDNASPEGRGAGAVRWVRGRRSRGRVTCFLCESRERHMTAHDLDALVPLHAPSCGQLLVRRYRTTSPAETVVPQGAHAGAISNLPLQRLCAPHRACVVGGTKTYVTWFPDEIWTRDRGLDNGYGWGCTWATFRAPCTSTGHFME